MYMVFIDNEAQALKEEGKNYTVWENSNGMKPGKFKPIDISIERLNKADMVTNEYECAGYILKD